MQLRWLQPQQQVTKCLDSAPLHPPYRLHVLLRVLYSCSLFAYATDAEGATVAPEASLLPVAPVEPAGPVSDALAFECM
jgi:hypothetical protein